MPEPVGDVHEKPGVAAVIAVVDGLAVRHDVGGSQEAPHAVVFLDRGPAIAADRHLDQVAVAIWRRLLGVAEVDLGQYRERGVDLVRSNRS